MNEINFWNGNKSSYRQLYEFELLELLLSATQRSGTNTSIINDLTDYPSAEDEGNVFENGTDVLVTVKGNAKFAGKRFIELPYSITKDLLGQRIPFIRSRDLAHFANPEALKTAKCGVPETWVDAELYRQNEFNVIESGSFEDVFERLSDGEFDYVCFGANEALDIYENRVIDKGAIIMAPDVMIEYSFPLVFYVNADRPQLAERLMAGFEEISRSGAFSELYSRYFGSFETKLSLDKRQRLLLNNPFIA
ncbi:transporter substrate-binding domain-containing protein [Vibrio hangzhouensis]|uniref:transporter substrate-binding domain-containing protein n=1 Tax=Vibrio hangzhouensis TaxID=462991 RepID=UPI001C97B470|nr:transporter substrate-binding domain-containing protein [Vibrio hangzhouensis]MBY6198254.1 transporter substrate-binding domain-containing protein [Vibrio hangzhouensis]